jgi:hypothetical protein
MREQPDPEESHAQMARARTRGSVHQTRPGAHPLPEPTTQSARSALERARQNWSNDDTQAPPAPPSDDELDDRGDDGAGTPPPPFRGPSHPSPLNSWSAASPPIRETWANYRAGAARTTETSPIMWIPYWTVAVVCFAVHCLFRLGQDSTTSVTRSLVFATVIGILILGLTIAL